MSRTTLNLVQTIPGKKICTVIMSDNVKFLSVPGIVLDFTSTSHRQLYSFELVSSRPIL